MMMITVQLLIMILLILRLPQIGTASVCRGGWYRCLWKQTHSFKASPCPAIQPQNCSPAPDYALRKPIFPYAFFSRGVFFPQTPVFSLSLYIYIYIYVYMHLFMILFIVCVYISLSLYIYIYIHIYVYIYIYIYLYLSLSIHVYIYIHICMSLSLSIYIYICVYIYIYIHTYIMYTRYYPTSRVLSSALGERSRCSDVVVPSILLCYIVMLFYCVIWCVCLTCLLLDYQLVILNYHYVVVPSILLRIMYRTVRNGVLAHGGGGQQQNLLYLFPKFRNPFWHKTKNSFW